MQNNDEYNKMKSCVAVSVFMADINYYEQTRFYEVQEKESENTNGNRPSPTIQLGIHSLRTFQTNPNQCWLINRTKKHAKWTGVSFRVNYCCSARQRKTECMPKTNEGFYLSTHLLFTFHRQWRSFHWTFFHTECISKKNRHRIIASKKIIISAAWWAMCIAPCRLYSKAIVFVYSNTVRTLNTHSMIRICVN